MVPTVRLTLRMDSSTGDFFAAFRGPVASLGDDVVSRAFSRPWSCWLAYDFDVVVGVGGHEDGGEVEALGFPVVDGVADVEHVHAADHVVERAEAELGHDLADFFGEEEEEVDDVFGLAGEFLAELGVLRGDADGAGVEVALAHHDAAERDERRGGEAEFFGAEQRGDDDVAAGLELAVGLAR